MILLLISFVINKSVKEKLNRNLLKEIPKLSNVAHSIYLIASYLMFLCACEIKLSSRLSQVTIQLKAHKIN